jgi:DNA-binding SARP family transcriptional activator
MIYSDEINNSLSSSAISSGQWQSTIKFLTFMRNDYQTARKQLEQLSLQLAEREALVDQCIQHTFISSQGYHTLCLTGDKSCAPVNRMGSIILGEVTRPPEVPNSNRIDVRCLGLFEIYSDHSKISRWNSTKAKSVLQYLLIKPRDPTTKDTLIEALWPDCEPRAASNNLKAAVHNLRLTLNNLPVNKHRTPFILFREGSYLINSEINIWIDIEEFQNYWTEGRRLEKKGKITEAIREFERAEILYGGDYLEDEYYEEWTLLRRESIKDTYLIILSKLAEYSIQTADYESCIHYSQKILAKDQCRENTYRMLMYCYANLGQKNRALRWYEICQKTNKSEFGTEPGSATYEMYNKILNDEELQYQ